MRLDFYYKGCFIGEYDLSNFLLLKISPFIFLKTENRSQVSLESMKPNVVKQIFFFLQDFSELLEFRSRDLLIAVHFSFLHLDR